MEVLFKSYFLFNALSLFRDLQGSVLTYRLIYGIQMPFLFVLFLHDHFVIRMTEGLTRPNLLDGQVLPTPHRSWQGRAEWRSLARFRQDLGPQGWLARVETGPFPGNRPEPLRSMVVSNSAAGSVFQLCISAWLQKSTWAVTRSLDS